MFTKRKDIVTEVVRQAATANITRHLCFRRRKLQIYFNMIEIFDSKRKKVHFNMFFLRASFTHWIIPMRSI